MNGSLTQVEQFVAEFLPGLPGGFEESGLRVVICPPHPYLAAAGQRLAGSGVALGAQKVHPLPSGAFTGEVSPTMLRELGVTACIIGHSEHRQHFAVTDAIIAEKLHGLIAEKITPILCVGETLAEREAGRQEQVIEAQLMEALKESEGKPAGRRQGDRVNLAHPALSPEAAKMLTVAYEPVWAIGTGKTATPELAGEMHGHIRAILDGHYGAALAHKVPLLYGGSVTPDNAGQLLSQSEVDGVLVGGASLKASSLLTIVNHALN